MHIRPQNQRREEDIPIFLIKKIEILVSVIQEFKNIMECKKTDVTTWREKDLTWENVAEAFNSSSSEVFRSKKNFKIKI